MKVASNQNNLLAHYIIDLCLSEAAVVQKREKEQTPRLSVDVFCSEANFISWRLARVY